jgi:DNA polymerase-3 subunit gamma/tau
MVLIRLAHASELPTPGELVRSLRGEPGTALNAAAPAGAGGGSGGATSRPRAVMSGPAGGSTGVVAGTAVLAAEAVAEAQVRAPAQAPQPEPEARDLVTLESFVEVVALARARKEGILANHLEGDLHLVRFEPGIIEFRPGERAPNDLAGRLGRCLQDWTGRRWMVGVSSASGAPSLREQRQARDAERLEEAAQDPLVQEVMTLFPGARIVEVREAAADQGGERDDPEPPTAKERQEDER